MCLPIYRPDDDIVNVVDNGIPKPKVIDPVLYHRRIEPDDIVHWPS